MDVFVLKYSTTAEDRLTTDPPVEIGTARAHEFEFDQRTYSS